MSVILVVVVVSGSLVVGSAIGASDWLSDMVVGFVIALAGGALLVSTSLELFQPVRRGVGGVVGRRVRVGRCGRLQRARPFGRRGVGERLRGRAVASLATEVFPKAYREDGYATGVAKAIGVVLAIARSTRVVTICDCERDRPGTTGP